MTSTVPVPVGGRTVRLVPEEMTTVEPELVPNLTVVEEVNPVPVIVTVVLDEPPVGDNAVTVGAPNAKRSAVDVAEVTPLAVTVTATEPLDSEGDTAVSCVDET